MRIITQDEFDEHYNEHQKWMETGGRNGVCMDLPHTDFRNILLPDRPRLAKANLRYTNLQKAKLQKADLRGADLCGADLRKVDLRGANLQKAKMQNADLRNSHLQETSFQGANLLNTNLKEANLRGALLPGSAFLEENPEGLEYLNLGRESLFLNNNLSNKFERTIYDLEREKVDLMASNENKEKEINEKNEQIAKLQAEQKRIRDEQEKAKAEFEKKKIDDLAKAFTTLEDAGNDIQKEILRLQLMFYGYNTSIFTIIFFLFVIWKRYIDCTHLILDFFDASKYLSPSIVLIGLLIVVIYQSHKCQRQLVSLRKFLYKPLQIKGVLEAYIYINGNDGSNMSQINKVLDSFVSHIITHDVDINKEEADIKELDKKEQLPYKEAFDTILEIVKNYKQ